MKIIINIPDENFDPDVTPIEDMKQIVLKNAEQDLAVQMYNEYGPNIKFEVTE